MNVIRGYAAVMGKGNWLTLLIIVGLVAGVLFGQYVLFDPDQPIDDTLKQLGTLILIRPLMLLIVPLIFVSVIVGVTSIGDPSRLGVVGGATVVYYLATMLLAVCLGTALVTVFEPGSGLDPTEAESLRMTGEAEYQADPSRREAMHQAESLGLGGAWLSIVHQVIPTNVVEEMATTRPLGIIIFALLLGLALAAGGEKTKPAVTFFEAMFDAIMRLVAWVIWLTPIGVFLLVAWTVGSIGLKALAGPISKYIVIVLAGLFIHGVIVLPIVLMILGRTNPFRFMWQMRRALLTAFGTDSSSATLPVTIQSAETEGGCSKRASNFVLPLGATVNMDGTALYEAVAVVFLFQLYGIELSFGELLIVVITATLAAVGAAGIPSAGLVTMVIVITAVNTSLHGRGVAELPMSAIGVIIAVDRIVDMCRTTVNVWGDAVGAKIITRIAPDVEDEKEKALA
jgi:solute carrier family 1 (high affinity glutamate transporter) protein 1